MSLDIWLTIKVDTGGPEPVDIQLHDDNCTGNVVPMWRIAGVYDALYESAGKCAGDILPTLKAGVERMEASPEEYIKLNPSNGWGDYPGALEFLKRMARACEQHPKATIGVWR